MEVEKKIEVFIQNNEWKACLQILKTIIDKTELEASIKWGIPTYCINNKNVLGLIGFKNHCGIWFYNGSYLKDEKQVLINAQEGKTKAMRSWKFTSLASIKKEKKWIITYVNEAIKNQKEGNVLKLNTTKKPLAELPAELIAAFKNQKSLVKDFDKFTDSKKNEFIEYISSAKKAVTKLSRIEKITPLIEQGIGLNDMYK